jgi:hypothetical protein
MSFYIILVSSKLFKSFTILTHPGETNSDIFYEEFETLLESFYSLKGLIIFPSAYGVSKKLAKIRKMLLIRKILPYF